MTDDIRDTESVERLAGLVPSPPERSPRLDALEALMGEWVLGDPSAPIGRTDFAWLTGGFFLVQRWTVDIPGAPDGICILGADARGELVQHYYDSRGVARIYRMRLEDGVWTLWRDGSDFSQRFTGRFGDDGATISGAWEIAPDGTTWEHHFDILYTRVG